MGFLIGLMVLFILTMIAIYFISSVDSNKSALLLKYGKDYRVEKVHRSHLKYKYYVCKKVILEVVENHYIICVMNETDVVFEHHIKNSNEQEVRKMLNTIISGFEFPNESTSFVQEEKAEKIVEEK